MAATETPAPRWMQRTSGILLHPTSLPGASGIGDLGEPAERFADFLAQAGQQLWQVLPLGPTGYGDSPYQCFSAFAGNTLLISLERLAALGVLEESELRGAPAFPETEVDYQAVSAFKLPLLSRAAERFAASAPASAREGLAAFSRDNAAWLEDFALYMALKDAHDGRAWTEWDADIAGREEDALARWRSQLAAQLDAVRFHQYVFSSQWEALRARCHASGIRLFGDVPIFVAHDSADVWAHPELFQLRRDGRPEVIAGVPPDYFSATGQCWGNPLYRWDAMARTGYRWWIERVRAALQVVDLIRLDHFRGFEAYWEVPGEATTAVNGRWVKGPGAALFEALRRELGELPLVAENLGVITPEVEALRESFDLPGMAILQFAFGTDPQAGTFLPHNYPRNLAVYTGTHDNDTTVGWWTSVGTGDSTRTEADVEAERAMARDYLDAEDRQIHWAFIRAVLASVADVAMVPMQDVLGLGSEARMNVPARASGNWRWRMRAADLTPELAARLRRMAEVYGRVPMTREDAADEGLASGLAADTKETGS